MSFDDNVRQNALKPIEAISRRDFIQRAAVSMAAAGAVLRVQASGADGNDGESVNSSPRRRYAIVGVGSRSQMFQDAIETQYSDFCELTAICDTNEGRLALARSRSTLNGQQPPRAYIASDFDRLVEHHRPDEVIVTTMDSTHDQYIVRAMELGCDVITEKPMTTHASKCQAIVDAQRQTGRQCRVTFNYRYSPPRTQVKQLLDSGLIGDVLSVDFNWLLNTHHGADYFRRWHSHKANSGGLLVHKATHHFDLVNWWLSAIPVSVYAKGKREFYTPEMAKRIGLKSYHTRCHECPEADLCGFEFSLANNAKLRQLYLENEQFDGYFRDRCVFRPDIDIEDTMNAVVEYDNGALLSYSLNAFNAWEGYTIAFNGTKGRLEHSIVEQTYVSGTDTVQGGIAAGGIQTRFVPLRGEAEDISVDSGAGSHGGGDELLLDDLFSPVQQADQQLRAADHRSGAYSVMIGIAGNHSIEQDRVVRIDELVQGIDYPDYPQTPSRADRLPMPQKI